MLNQQELKQNWRVPPACVVTGELHEELDWLAQQLNNNNFD